LARKVTVELPHPPGETAMTVVLGPYPLCPACRETNGGLIAVQHRQVHLRAHGKESCVDRGLAGLIANLWDVCDTRSCCENENGRAYVVPTLDTQAAAERLLASIGLSPELRDGVLYFHAPQSAHLYDALYVRQSLERPNGRVMSWRVDENGRFNAL
jgi:hypothetical protein